MKTTFKSLLSIMMVVLAFTFTACEGEEGEIGPVGPKGDTGEQGPAGENGAPGEKGEGANEATSFGNILVTVTGNDPNGEPFTEDIDFKYLMADDLQYTTFTVDTEGRKQFSIGRGYIPSTNSIGKTAATGNNRIYVYFREHDGEIEPTQFQFYAPIVTDKQMFYVHSNNNYYGGTGLTLLAYDITDYNFDASTGELSFSFNYSFLNAEEETIEIKGSANVIVLEGMGHI